MQILFGGLFLVFLYLLSISLNLNALFATLNIFLSSLVVISVVLFSNEIKKGLASISFDRIRNNSSKLSDPYFFDRIAQAFELFQNSSIGALVAIERNQSLKQYADSGTVLDARLSSPLLVSIFCKESPLHDGAVLINKKLQLHAAACILPLTSRIDLKVKMGTRHRSAIGLTEESDCLVLVVSEETGKISLFQDGIQRVVKITELKKVLAEVMEVELSS